MPNHIATFNRAGSMPVVELFMGGVSYCKFHFFVQAPSNGAWVEIGQGDNKQSVRKLVLDPTIFPPHKPRVNAIAEMNGWQFGWSITFFGFSAQTQEPYDFTLSITQDGVNVMAPVAVAQDSFDAPSISFNDSCALVA